MLYDIDTLGFVAQTTRYLIVQVVKQRFLAASELAKSLLNISLINNH